MYRMNAHSKVVSLPVHVITINVKAGPFRLLDFNWLKTRSCRGQIGAIEPPWFLRHGTLTKVFYTHNLPRRDVDMTNKAVDRMGVAIVRRVLPNKGDTAQRPVSLRHIRMWITTPRPRVNLDFLQIFF